MGEKSAPMVPQFFCVRSRWGGERGLLATDNQPCWASRTTSCPHVVMPKLANTRSATLPIPPICRGRRARELNLS
jgi:hypothetical protein